MAEHPDRLLAARGDEAAFSEFFEAHFGALFRFAMPRVENDPQAAEEVVQAAMCRAIRKLSSYRGEAALLTWLCTFCRHEISDHFARQRKEPPTLDLIDEVPEVRAALDPLAAAEMDRGEDDPDRPARLRPAAGPLRRRTGVEVH